MTRRDYTALDAAILKAVSERGPIDFTPLLGVFEVKEEAEKLEAAARGKSASRFDEKPAWRFVDGRLQVLRRHGLIRYQRGSRGGWVKC